jgi:catechol-2,3-dioxygenase
MVSRIAQCTLDVQDVATMSEFWSAALGYRAIPDEGDSVHLVPADESSAAPTMWLQPVDTPKTDHKNRCHLDLRADDQAAEVERLIQLGASRADVGQTGTEGFIVMADPEGNEFCVLGS